MFTFLVLLILLVLMGLGFKYIVDFFVRVVVRGDLKSLTGTDYAVMISFIITCGIISILTVASFSFGALLSGGILAVLLLIGNSKNKNKEKSNQSVHQETVYDRQLKFELNHLKELVEEGSITQETAEQRKKSLIEKYNS